MQDAIENNGDYKHPIGRFTPIPDWATPQQRELMERYNVLMWSYQWDGSSDSLILDYSKYRALKAWHVADAIRKIAKDSLGVIIEVRRDGTTDWRRA